MEKVSAVAKSIGTLNWQALLVGLIGLAILIVWPKISKKIPGSLIAVVVGAVILGGLYALFNGVILPRLNTEIGEMFNYTA